MLTKGGYDRRSDSCGHICVCIRVERLWFHCFTLDVGKVGRWYEMLIDCSTMRTHHFLLSVHWCRTKDDRDESTTIELISSPSPSSLSPSLLAINVRIASSSPSIDQWIRRSDEILMFPMSPINRISVLYFFFSDRQLSAWSFPTGQEGIEKLSIVRQPGRMVKHLKFSSLAFLRRLTWSSNTTLEIGNRKESKWVQQCHCLQKALRQPLASFCEAYARTEEEKERATTIGMLFCSTILAWVITIHT